MVHGEENLDLGARRNVTQLLGEHARALLVEDGSDLPFDERGFVPFPRFLPRIDDAADDARTDPDLVSPHRPVGGQGHRIENLEGLVVRVAKTWVRITLARPASA